jgi:Arc/MetJ-type ribon-helix-helix transcriptional regulator
MNKKVLKPSSIRLTPAADAWILNWVKATDLSMSALINRAILITRATLMEERREVQALCEQLRTLAKLRQIDAAAAAKKAEVRAAAKGAK